MDFKNLKDKDKIDALFERKKYWKGKNILFYFNTSIIQEISKPSVHIAFSVPKRLFSKAVDRNKIKRQMREAVRTSEKTSEPISMDLMLVFQSKKKEDFWKIKKDIKSFLIFIDEKES